MTAARWALRSPLGLHSNGGRHDECNGTVVCASGGDGFDEGERSSMLVVFDGAEGVHCLIVEDDGAGLAHATAAERAAAERAAA